jgi:hypothetical protein
VLERPALAQRTWAFSFIAPWRIPGFIKACDIIAFLEREFEIAFHGPQVPREVLASGRALLVSSEIVKKQPMFDLMESGKHYIDAGDPRDTTTLTEKLRRWLEDRAGLREMGERARAALAIPMYHDADGVIDTLRAEGLLLNNAAVMQS